MTKTTWRDYVDQLNAVLAAAQFTDARGATIDPDAAFDQWTQWARATVPARRCVYLVGNGASATMASHFAADLAKNGGLHTQVFTDMSLITAISNDISYEQVFAQPLRVRGQAGDMLVGISSSGKSPNVLAAVAVARELGMRIVTLSAMSPQNSLRASGDLNLHVPAKTYGQAESAHGAVLHRWMDMVEAAKK